MLKEGRRKDAPKYQCHRGAGPEWLVQCGDGGCFHDAGVRRRSGENHHFNLFQAKRGIPPIYLAGPREVMADFLSKVLEGIKKVGEDHQPIYINIQERKV